MTYCIYHIPGKKIGVTNDPERRITCQQGYTEDEYDILAMSDDIDYISELEIELQKKYGYKVDRQLYKNLPMNKPLVHLTFISQVRKKYRKLVSCTTCSTRMKILITSNIY